MDDRDLSALLQDAVADVEPADRLSEIRHLAADRPHRFGWYAAGGTALAVAASVTAFSLITSPDSQRADDVDPAGPPPSSIVSETPGTSGTPGLGIQAVYFVGDTPSGPRLFREFHRVGGGPSPEVAAQSVTRAPYDPDYRTMWPESAFASVDVRDGVINVTLSDSTLHDRPAGMTEFEAELALQQLVYSVQAGQGSRAPVQLRLGRNPIDTVYGVPTSEPITNLPQLDVLSLVSISDPVEGLPVTDSFIANGAASSFEGNVPWQLRAPDGAVVRSGQTTAGMATHLIAWATEPIDVSDLDPGRYLFVATTDDRTFTDTRTIVVQ